MKDSGIIESFAENFLWDVLENWDLQISDSILAEVDGMTWSPTSRIIHLLIKRPFMVNL